MSRIKVVGYAKKEVFGNGIEYRNFSPDLVGNQFGAAEGTPIFTSGNFNISTNIEGKVNKNFITNEFTNFLSLETLNVDSTLESIITKYSKNAKLNLDYSNVLTYAFFGSLREYIRVSLENIIIKWPASLYIREVDASDPTITGDTVTNYVYNSSTNSSTFQIETDRVENMFSINFLSGGTIENTFNETNTLRNLVLNYLSYDVTTSGGTFPILNLSGATGLTNSVIYLSVEGNPFPNYGSEIINYHIKPNDKKIEEFFFNLNEFENNLLNRLTIPKYTSTFKVYNESETGDIIESIKKLSWPISDGYNIDFNSISYANYVTQLLEIADNADNSKSNLMVRFLVSSSISEFDSVPDINGIYPDSNGQKMTNTLKIYGREFDEVKKYSDGIKFANTVTYDKKNNTPDVVLKNLARILGWELTSSISQVDVLSNFLSLNNNYYDGHSRGYSDAEAEIELWRRIVLNTPWIWKSKGTRKAIEFLFKFIGAPDGLVSFNEYLYVADKPVNVPLLTEMMEYFNDTNDISDINVDSDGFPKTFPNTPEMYFQKAGLWYRQTGGLTPDIDILEGNNPHIGPYDGGQAYIDQFMGCLVPNYSGGTTEEIDIDAEINLFTNYGNGTFDECCDSNVLVVLNTDHDFDSILISNLDKIYDNYPVIDCDIINSWTLTASLTGETIYTNTFFTSSGSTTGSTAGTISGITEVDYVNALIDFMDATTGSTLSGASYIYSSGDTSFTITSPNGCDSELLDTYFKIDLCLDSSYNCPDNCITGLTSFSVSVLTDDACSPTNALPLIGTYFHDGSGVLPTIGDNVYSDDCGLTPVYHPSGETVYMGGDFTKPTNWLQTDVNGVMEEIICPVINCNVLVGTDSTLSGEDSITIFTINGVNEYSIASLRFEVFDIVAGLGGASSTIRLTIDDGQYIINATESSPPSTTNREIFPNGGSLFGLNDYEVKVIVDYPTFAESFKVKMTLTGISNGCVSGTNEAVISINNIG